MKTSRAGSPEGPAFLASEIPDLPAGSCRVHVLPVPYEASVSYGTGTAGGPCAILEASIQLEAFDGQCEPCSAGIHTHPAMDCSGATETVLGNIETVVGRILSGGHLPLLLGGEHTVTLGAVRALAATGRSFGVIQFDAHADLRDCYEDNRYSHACVMRRVVELGIPLYQVGVRALSRAEHAWRLQKGIGHADARDLWARGPAALTLPAGFPAEVYVSFDVDAFDPALMPATGTPEPGGLDWPAALQTLQRLLSDRTLLGADVVELAPIAGMHAPDFTAARLAYTLIGFGVR